MSESLMPDCLEGLFADRLNHMRGKEILVFIHELFAVVLTVISAFITRIAVVLLRVPSARF